jgi:hypothetical protein
MQGALEDVNMRIWTAFTAGSCNIMREAHVTHSNIRETTMQDFRNVSLHIHKLHMVRIRLEVRFILSRYRGETVRALCAP